MCKWYSVVEFSIAELRKYYSGKNSIFLSFKIEFELKGTNYIGTYFSFTVPPGVSSSFRKKLCDPIVFKTFGSFPFSSVEDILNDPFVPEETKEDLLFNLDILR